MPTSNLIEILKALNSHLNKIKRVINCQLHDEILILFQVY